MRDLQASSLAHKLRAQGFYFNDESIESSTARECRGTSCWFLAVYSYLHCTRQVLIEVKFLSSVRLRATSKAVEIQLKYTSLPKTRYYLTFIHVSIWTQPEDSIEPLTTKNHINNIDSFMMQSEYAVEVQITHTLIWNRFMGNYIYYSAKYRNNHLPEKI